jgi:hypothetical protein
LRIFKFQGTSGTQTELDFFGINIFPGQRTWEEEAHKRAHEAQRIIGGVGLGSSRATDTQKCRGSLKSSMGSIIQIYSLSQGDQTRILARL